MGISITQAGKAAYERYKQAKSAKKAKELFESVKKVLDEDSRSGELVKLSIKYGAKAVEKIIGASISKHPYFTYHKAHIEALVAVLNASDTHANAMKALHDAVESADAAEALTKSLDALTGRKKALLWEYHFYLAGNLHILSDLSHAPSQAADELKDVGQTADSMRTSVEADMYAWRAKACELYFDASDQYAMADVEYRAAAAAMARYDAKLKKLDKSTKSIDRIAQYATIRDRQYEELERDPAWNSSSKSSPQAVHDPSGWALTQRDKVEAVARVLATICDVAMSDTAYDPDAVNRAVGSL
jgi:hypothetical protein